MKSQQIFGSLHHKAPWRMTPLFYLSIADSNGLGVKFSASSTASSRTRTSFKQIADPHSAIRQIIATSTRQLAFDLCSDLHETKAPSRLQADLHSPSNVVWSIPSTQRRLQVMLIIGRNTAFALKHGLVSRLDEHRSERAFEVS